MKKAWKLYLKSTQLNLRLTHIYFLKYVGVHRWSITRSWTYKSWKLFCQPLLFRRDTMERLLITMIFEYTNVFQKWNLVLSFIYTGESESQLLEIFTRRKSIHCNQTLTHELKEGRLMWILWDYCGYGCCGRWVVDDEWRSWW